MVKILKSETKLTPKLYNFYWSYSFAWNKQSQAVNRLMKEAYKVSRGWIFHTNLKKVDKLCKRERCLQ